MIRRLGREGNGLQALRVLAHGGSGPCMAARTDTPSPVPVAVYDETIRGLKTAVVEARLGRDDELAALQRLDDQDSLVRTDLGRCGYNAWQVEVAVAKVPMVRLGIVKRSDDMKGSVVLLRRWVVERTFSWFGRNRRLA